MNNTNPSREEFITQLKESLKYCMEADEAGAVDGCMGLWQEWILSWPDKILDEFGGI